jgi:hypothetical protein
MTTRTVIWVVCGAFLLSAAAFAQNRPPDGCLQNRSGQVLCNPPFGGIAADSSGQPFCGPGECINQDGRVICSSVEGGGAAQNSAGVLICTGRCIFGTTVACAHPARR